ncbi:hypothetical protein RAA17_15285 [Komagataeibacter rhaeticus]|nr:hypothetical protein [Komagataeibacter rhaeticus]
MPVHGARAQAARIPVRVVVVTTFEIGNDEGDQPGEFQHWVEKLPLPQVLPFPGGTVGCAITRTCTYWVS